MPRPAQPMTWSEWPAPANRMEGTPQWCPRAVVGATEEEVVVGMERMATALPERPPRVPSNICLYVLYTVGLNRRIWNARTFFHSFVSFENKVITPVSKWWCFTLGGWGDARGLKKSKLSASLGQQEAANRVVLSKKREEGKPLCLWKIRTLSTARCACSYARRTWRRRLKRDKFKNLWLVASNDRFWKRMNWSCVLDLKTLSPLKLQASVHWNYFCLVLIWYRPWGLWLRSHSFKIFKGPSHHLRRHSFMCACAGTASPPLS